MSETTIDVEAPDFVNMFNRALDSIEKDMNLPFSKYMRDVLEASKKDIAQRSTWSREKGSIYQSLDASVKDLEGEIDGRAPHAYLRQWGETRSGETMIYPKRANALLINKTGMDLESFKALSKDELKERFVYGQDYWFAQMARIVSNPYIAIPGLSDAARQKIAGYEENKEVSEKLFEKFIDAILEIVSHVLRSIGYEQGIHR